MSDTHLELLLKLSALRDAPETVTAPGVGEAAACCPYCGGDRGHWEGCKAPVESPTSATPAPQGDRLVRAALAWWEGKRPGLYNLEDHIANPRVNCAGDRERDLATAIAAQAREVGNG